jgi:hypothetical protein
VHANEDKNRVRTLFQKGKLAQLSREMDRYKLDILGVSEVKIERKWAHNVTVPPLLLHLPGY